MKIESQEFRNATRANCYKYGSLYVYSDEYVSLDRHNFPKYSSKDSVGAVEKFISLVQGLKTLASGNDATDKLSKPLPGVQWSGDDLSLTINLTGKMYFTSYSDCVTMKNRIRRQVTDNGWSQFVSRSESTGISIETYKPARNGVNALYNDDPMDAAGLAMMTSAMQHTADQVNMLTGYFGDNAETYAKGYARFEAMATDRSGLGALGGFGQDIKAGIQAMGSNMNSGMIAKWLTAGHSVRLLVDGQEQQRSVPLVMTDATFTDQAFVVDKTSGGHVYPTEMYVSITLVNMYGSLATASKEA